MDMLSAKLRARSWELGAGSYELLIFLPRRVLTYSLPATRYSLLFWQPRSRSIGSRRYYLTKSAPIMPVSKVVNLAPCRFANANGKKSKRPLLFKAERVICAVGTSARTVELINARKKPNSVIEQVSTVDRLGSDAYQKEARAWCECPGCTKATSKLTSARCFTESQPKHGRHQPK